MKSITTDDFEYSMVDAILQCDASYNERYKSAGLGWRILNQNRSVGLEGRMCKDCKSTVEAELDCILIGLEELQKYNAKNIIIQTDLSQVVYELSKNPEQNKYAKIKEFLNCSFNTWAVENKSRDALVRVHKLAHSVDIGD